ncbi:methyltransferase domain-containing protein [Nonomuraea sp. 3-1Str]|uniref:TRM11 family SAM-dependent methyltransferase n=1 Tax=Nonomuraea sp. 3-1Str TaxID=2929801 RepID=UPI00286099C4|nr:methyltransferase domain-containing protein [Nonomuraea sp. 3-1Str]MDR8411551.1 methyltransferase domain-containing protein [Nonomuraea sp. 3-1Str]
MRAFAVARAVRGIEPLVAAEIMELGVVRRLRHREVWFEVAEPGPGSGGLLGLRTADDVLLAAAVVDGVGPGRAALARLRRAAADADAETPLKFRRAAAPPRTRRQAAQPGTPDGLDAPGGLEVSATFVGRRSYSRFDVEDAVGAGLSRALGVPYHSRAGGVAPPPGAVPWRVTIEGDQAVIAVRLGERPLHRRPYKVDSIPGTLHPPLAAAMAVLAGLGRPPAGGAARGGGPVVLDPCCGAGTTLTEAGLLAPHARLAGADRSPVSVRAAAANTARAGVRAALAVADAGRLPLPSRSVDRVLVNPPWGRQVAAAGLLARDGGLLWREGRRVLAPGGLAGALGDGVPGGFRVERVIEVSLSGRPPALAVLSVANRRR